MRRQHIDAELAAMDQEIDMLLYGETTATDKEFSVSLDKALAAIDEALRTSINGLVGELERIIKKEGRK